ncbi:MAG TPA: Type 1 glutamine amidotransferase-like domain-containing protein [Blastocatellia bacterium]|jgi:cyanophycinase-like exopeptidase|nr:Type 1 glutamine amidotransferase-like domain-containing protein [Blastocatellia bacterium]
MSSYIQPIYLFADSAPLFWIDGGGPFMNSVRSLIQSDSPRAAYVGASNGDNPDYYSIFEAAMDNIGISDCRMIPSRLSSDDESFMNEADIILLAGGDVEKGWNTFQENGLSEAIVRRYYEGSLLMGVSAGAVQLGLLGWPENDESAGSLFYTFKLVPWIIDAHDEDRNWDRLKKAVEFAGENMNGIGIPKGGGLIYHPDGSIEPIRQVLYEFYIKDKKVDSNLLFPGKSTEAEEGSDIS